MANGRMLFQAPEYWLKVISEHHLQINIFYTETVTPTQEVQYIYFPHSVHQPSGHQHKLSHLGRDHQNIINICQFLVQKYLTLNYITVNDFVVYSNFQSSFNFQ